MYFVLTYPITGQGTGYVGEPRSDHLHEGYDFAAPIRTPVYASHAGFVSSVGQLGDYDLRVDIRFEDSPTNFYMTRYAHLNEAVVGQDQRVAQGELVGYSGDASVCWAEPPYTCPHLHWEFMRDSDYRININDEVPYYGDPPNRDYSKAFVVNGAPVAFGRGGFPNEHQQGEWHLLQGNNINNGQVFTSAFKYVKYGLPGDFPIVGDWNGDGKDQAGVVRFNPNTGNLDWYRSSTNLNNVAGGGTQLATSPNPVTSYGGRGDIPIVGDWDYNLTDTPGINRWVDGAIEWHLNYSFNDQLPDITPFNYGLSGYGGDRPIAGNWNGTGADGVGITRANWGVYQWYLDNSFGNGADYAPFLFGSTATDYPFRGSWLGSNDDLPFITRMGPSGREWYRTSGFCNCVHSMFYFGQSDDFPMLLDWDTNDAADDYVLVR